MSSETQVQIFVLRNIDTGATSYFASVEAAQAAGDQQLAFPGVWTHVANNFSATCSQGWQRNDRKTYLAIEPATLNLD
jgi:hypothetical protein